LNPVQWNILAIVFILGFMPFAVALVSNAGSSTDEAWINSMQLHDENIPLQDNSFWLENGGSNLTSWYDTYYPPNTDDKLDCAYITNGVCEGVYSDTGPMDPEVWMSLSGNPQPYPFGGYFRSSDYFDVRHSNIKQSHQAPGFGNAYAGRSGSEIFSWLLSPYYINEIEQGETLDSLRYWMVESQAYNCNVNFENNITFQGEISFLYGNDTITYDNFEFETSNRFEYSQFDDNQGTWDQVCSVGFFVEFDFTGFESLEIYNFNNIGDWDNTSIILTLKNFVNLESPDSFGSTLLPFAGNDDWYLGVQHREMNPVEAGFLIKTGTLILAVIVFLVALSSTPYFDPLMNSFKGRV
jgi:hypothetical protein